MADKKISALTSSTTPLTGAEVLPIVQTGSTVKTTVASLTSYAPAFGAYNAGTQVITAGVATKAIFDSEYFDTNSNFASNRFTPTIAGYYQLSTGVFFNGAGGIKDTYLYKNGSNFATLNRTVGTANGTINTGSVLVYANGTTDYFEIYAYCDLGITLGASSAGAMYFNGSMVRSG